MPKISELSPEQINELKAKGFDAEQYSPDTEIEIVPPQPSESGGIVRNALAPLKAHAGETLGAGVGGLVGMSPALPWNAAAYAAMPATGGLSLAVPLVSGAITALGAGTTLKYGQEKILGEERQAALEAEAQRAYQESPVIARGTELVAGALIGGRPSIRNLKYALGKGLPTELGEEAVKSLRREAVGNVVTGNILGAATQTGVGAAQQLYNTGTIDAGELAKSAGEGLITGAVFSNPNWLGKTMNPRWKTIEEHEAALKESQNENINDTQSDRHDEILAETARIGQDFQQQFRAKLPQLLNEALGSEQKQSVLSQAERIDKTVANAEVWLNPEKMPDSQVIAAFKKLRAKFKPKDSQDATDQANNLAEYNRLSQLNNEEKRIALYEREIAQASPEIAGQVKQKAAHVREEVQWNEHFKRKQLQEQVDAENARVAQVEAAAVRQQQAQAERAAALEQAQAEEAAIRQQQEAEALRQRNLQLVAEGQRQTAIARGIATGQATPERVALANLSQQAEQGRMAAVARPVNRPPATMPTGEQTIAPREFENTGVSNEQRGDAERIQDEMEERGAKFAPERARRDDSDMLSNAAELLKNPDTGFIQPNKSGAYNGSNLVNALRNRISESEFAVLKDAGIEEAFNGKIVAKDDAVKWIEENGPKVEVRKFGEGLLTPDQKRLSELVHWYDGLDGGSKDIIEKAGVQKRKKADDYAEQLLQNLSSDNYTRAKEYFELLDKGTPTPFSNNSSHWSFVAPKAEKDMPGYVEIAVVKPRKDVPGFPGVPSDKVQFPSSHNFPPNTLGFVRGYMETLPSGEKVFHVIEVQSDWAQRNRELKAEYGEHPTSLTAAPNDPLLPHYERLALKAAIDHARKEGATKIAISDAETAMMSEGHDRQPTYVDGKYHVPEMVGEHALSNTARKFTGNFEVRDGSLWSEVKDSEGVMFRKEALDSDYFNLLQSKIPRKPTQDSGMRLHYDRTLPKIASELTGSKGEVVGFGEHKNAYVKGGTEPAVVLPQPDGTWIATGVGDGGTRYNTRAEAEAVVNRGRELPRSNLIFRNTDGTPKTDVTARVYDITGTPERKPMMFGKKYAPESKEFKEWFGDSKVVDKDGKPLVVYHGSKNFSGDVFKPTQSVNRRGNPEAFYFTQHAEEASGYAENRKIETYDEGAQVLPVYLSVKNLFDIANGGRNKISQKMLDTYRKELETQNTHLDPKQSKDWFDGKVARLKETGEISSTALNADSAAFRRVIEAGDYDGIVDGSHFGAFYPEQIKSATGNRGTYDKTNQSIVKSPVAAREYGKTPISDALQQHIINNRATARSVLTRLAADKNQPYAHLAQQLLETATKADLDSAIVHKPGAKENSYATDDDVITLNKSGLNADTVVHEIAHALTLRKIPKHLYDGSLTGENLKRAIDEYLADPKGNKNVKELLNCYIETAKYLGVDTKLFRPQGYAGSPRLAQERLTTVHEMVGYGMGDLGEFLAQALSSREFQHTLNAIPTKTNKSVWSRFIRSVKNLLGVDVEAGKMLERVLAGTEQLVGDKRQFGFKPAREFYSPKTGAEKFSPKSIERESLQDVSKKGFLRILEGTFDRVERISTVIAQAFRKFEDTMTTYRAWKDTALVDLQRFKREDVDAVFAAHRDAYRNGTEPKLSGAQKQISNLVSKYFTRIGEERRRLGIKIDGREAGLSKYYVPDQLSAKAIDLFVNKSQTEEARSAKAEWIDYVTENIVKEQEAKDGKVKTPEQIKAIKKEVTSNITNYIEALGGSEANYRSVQFGAIRKASGYGLPETIREANAMEAINRYGNRAASDMAMFKELESRPEIAGSLKLANPETGKVEAHEGANPDYAQAQEIKDAMKWVMGNFSGTMSKHSPRTNALVRLVNNSILGTATGLRDIAQIPVNMLPYINSAKDIPAILKGIANFRDNSRLALETGARQPNIDRVQFEDMMNAPDKVTALTQKAATFMRRAQGREALENFARDLTFSIGKELARNNVLMAKAGNKKAKMFLDKFGLNVEGDALTLSGDKLDAALNKMAKNFTDRNQGTYGGRGLPNWVIESQFAPFWSLQKWSIEKSNVIYQDVYKPFMTGENRMPMLTYTLGTILTGAAIQELNELLTGRKAQDPTVGEALAHPDPKTIAAELATIMQLSSYAGIVGDSLKFATDTALRGKMPRNIVSFPTATTLIDLEQKSIDAAEAIRTGENPWEVFKMYALDVITHNVQAARMIANRTINNDKIEESNSFRDLRVFNEMEGKTSKDIAMPNKYLNLDAKDYKKARTVEEVVAALPAAIQDAVEKSNGDAYELRRRLSSLKHNSYNIMPSFETMPMSFVRYMNYLAQTQGQEAATERLTDYIKQRELNKVKSALLPET